MIRFPGGASKKRCMAQSGTCLVSSQAHIFAATQRYPPTATTINLNGPQSERAVSKRISRKSSAKIMIHSQHKPLPPPSLSSATNEVNKKKKRKNKKKKVTQVTEENVSDSDSDDEFSFLRSQNVGIVKSQPKPKPAASLVSHTNQLGALRSLWQPFPSLSLILSTVDDPVTVTIKQVMSKSHYSHERVASCVNRMWDTGLQYDSSEAVLMELQREVTINTRPILPFLCFLEQYHDFSSICSLPCPPPLPSLFPQTPALGRQEGGGAR
jgi:hypothetical protein